MKTIFTTVLLLCCINFSYAQDPTVGCDSPVSKFDDLVEGKIVSQIRTAHQYYMYSKDSSAGSTYTERVENLKGEMAKIFQTYMKERKEEYKKTVCSYYKTDWNQPGRSSSRTLTVQPGFYMLTNTLKRTTNSDWKDGPIWNPNETHPTTLTWRTGGQKRNETFVDVKAVYSDNYIKEIIIEELNVVRKQLNSIGIPTEMPAFPEG